MEIVVCVAGPGSNVLDRSTPDSRTSGGDRAKEDYTGSAAREGSSSNGLESPLRDILDLGEPLTETNRNAFSQGDILIRHCGGAAELEACTDLEKLVWNFSERDTVPVRVFQVTQDIGGHVIGAFRGSDLVAFVMAMPGARNSHSYLYSRAMAVREESQLFLSLRDPRHFFLLAHPIKQSVKGGTRARIQQASRGADIGID